MNFRTATLVWCFALIGCSQPMRPLLPTESAESEVELLARMPKAASLAFTSSSQSVKSASCSPVVNFQSQNYYIRGTKTPLVVTMSASDPAEFFSDSQCLAAVTTLTLDPGTNLAQFYFKPSLASGALTLTISAVNVAPASQVETILEADGPQTPPTTTTTQPTAPTTQPITTTTQPITTTTTQPTTATTQPPPPPPPTNPGDLSVGLKVQEANYPGSSTAGLDRVNEPFCVGVPIPESAGISQVSQLGMSGVLAAQFRALGRWPSGYLKWVEVCGVLSSLGAGAIGNAQVTGGSGAFGGNNLASDIGGTISVSTGAATFSIRKANFNVIDSATVGSTPIVLSSSDTSRGLVITGPSDPVNFPANVTCSPDTGGSLCTREYSSSRDPYSTCAIEVNGPVMAVIRCVGSHVDASGNAYMHFTVRETFYKGKTAVKVTSILRNADYSTASTPSLDCNIKDGYYCAGNTFNTSFKGMKSYEIRVSPNISGALNYTIASHIGNQSGQLTDSTQSAHIYQGQNSYLVGAGVEGLICDVDSSCANNYTPDKFYRVTVKGTNVVVGGTNEHASGWADISNANGTGVQIGMYHFAAQWPASLELNSGGTDIRIGLISRHNSVPYYQPWSEWKIHDSYLNFHQGPPASLENEFLKLQHHLLARAERVAYNTARVFQFPIVDPAVEDNFYIDAYNTASPKSFDTVNGPNTGQITLSTLCWLGSTTNCSGPDRGVAPNLSNNALNLGIFRGGYEWAKGGGLNQSELRMSDLWKWVQRGFAGRFLNSAHFYRFVAEKGFPHSDGTSRSDSTPNNFSWRTRPYFGDPANADETDGFVQPMIACSGDAPCPYLTNSRYMGGVWIPINAPHMHYYGIYDYYFMSGDETVRESFHTHKDFFMGQAGNYAWKARTLNYGNGFAPRAEGLYMMSAALFSKFLKAVGDPDADGVMGAADQVFTKAFRPDPCVNGFPLGCVAPPLDENRDDDPAGVSRIRGMLTSNGGRGVSHCNVIHQYRISQPLQQAIAEESLLVYLKEKGPNWADYDLAKSLMYGMSQWALNENFKYNNTSQWWTGGATNGSDPFWGLFNGFTSWTLSDVPNICPAGTPVPGGDIGEPTAYIPGVGTFDTRAVPQAHGDVWFHFYVNWLITGRTDWADKAKIAFVRHNSRGSNWPGNFGAYRLALITEALSNPGSTTLKDVLFTVSALSGGTYRLTFTPPAGSISLWIKWSPKRIAPSSGLLGYDVNTQTFQLNPNDYSTWFGANETTEPAPTPGVAQSFDVTTGTFNLSTLNFSVKVYAP
jgi:hypothetical protein